MATVPPAAATLEGAATVVSIRELAGAAVTLLDDDRPGTPPAAPTGKLGRYPVEGKLGEGGMGEVLMVRDPDLGRELAAKVIRGGRGASDGILLEKFVIEARVTGQLEHPGIVPVHELAVAPDGRIYFTMKRVRGRDLSKVLEELRERSARPSSRRLRAVRGSRVEPAAGEGSLDRLLDAFLKVCDAVAFAHSRGVIHRDLKPANIMVGEFGEVLVMDWGLCRMRNAKLGMRNGNKQQETAPGIAGGTMAGTVMGTPAYMPPEQARGDIDSIGEHSDIYSLGAILYEILALAPPFSGKDAGEVLDKVIEGRLVPPSRRAPHRHVPRELEAAVQKAMAPEPAERYQDVAELRADIEAHRAGRTLAAAEYSPWQLLAKWAKRNKIAVAGGAATAAALLVGALAIVYVAGRAEAERLRSVEETRLAAEADERSAREKEGEKRYEEGLALWGEAERTEVYNRAAPQGYFQSHAAALLAMGEGYEKHPERPAVWRETILARSIHLEDRAIEVGDWVLARLLVESTGNWGARTEGELEAARTRVRDALEKAAEEDIRRLEAALDEIAEREKKGALIDGELDERARRLARSTGPAATRRALELLARDPDRRPAGLGLAYLASFLGMKADAHTRAGETSAPRVILAALEEHAERPDPRRSDEGAGWVRAAERFETIRPGTLDGLGPLLERLASAGAGPVAVAAKSARERLGKLEAGRTVLAGTPLGSEDWERRVADFADLVLARSRSGRRYLAHLVELAAGQGNSPLSGSAAAFVHESIGLAGDPIEGALPALEAAFDRAEPGLRGGGREALEEAASAAIALSRLEAPGFSKKLYNTRYASGQGSPFWNRTRLAMGLMALDSAEPGSAAAYTRRGIARYDQGDLAGAIADYTREIELDPITAAAYSDRGIALYDRGDLAGAIADYTRAIELDPSNALGYSNRGAARKGQGDLAGAIADFTRAIELDPNFTTAYDNRGAVRRGQGDLAGAIADFTHAIELDPNYAGAYFNRGIARKGRGDLVGAIADYTRAIELDPNNAKTYGSRGAARYEQGNLAAGMEDLTRAIELDPTDVKVYTNRGLARRAQGDLAGAIADYTRAIELDPGFAAAYSNRGQARYDLGDLAGAIAEFTRAIELGPNDAMAYNNRGIALYARGDFAGAIADYTHAIELAPDHAAAYNNRGIARYAQSDHAGAISDCTRAIELDPNYAAAYINRGAARQVQGDLAGAIADYTRATELTPNCVLAYYNRGDAKKEQGDLSGAIADSTRAIELDPRYWQAWRNRGMALATLGRPEEAAESFKRALECCPPSERTAVEAARRKSLGD
ncbi:MAG: tetratricopeptide repeat protein [Planctomycetes bacterium]|nr:tetratricopeptide repeat protein [Planctomycetota bacterium]